MSPLLYMIQYNNDLVYPPLCTVFELDTGEFVYPIFKNGSSSLQNICKRKHFNTQLNNIDHIKVYWRDAQSRFSSAVNWLLDGEYKDYDKNTIVDLIQSGKLVNRHFMPQYMWLCHLYKYHTGTISIIDISNLNIPIHNKSKSHTTYEGLIHWIKLDDVIHKRFINKKTDIHEINEYVKENYGILYKKCIVQD